MAEDWTSTARNITRRTKRQNNTPMDNTSVADARPEAQASQLPMQDITPVKGGEQSVSVQKGANGNETRHRNFKRPRELKTKRFALSLTRGVFEKLKTLADSREISINSVCEEALAAYLKDK